MKPQLEGLLKDLEAILYARKSTVDDGKSTDAQLREMRAWCDSVGVPVAREIAEKGRSASRYATKSRDGWTELKGLLRPGHLLVVWEASRATRDIGEWAILRDLCAERKIPLAYNGRVLDLTDGDDRFTGGMEALLSEREAEMIRRRFARGKRDAVLLGTPPAALGWGYRAVPRALGDKRTKWEIDPHEADRIREAVRRVIAGDTLLSVLRWLQSTEGYSPATHTSLRRALRRPAIAGKLVHRGQVIGDAAPPEKGGWAPIITEEERQKVIAASNWQHPAPGSEPAHLCSGIATCGVCGGKVRHHTHKSRMDVYRCIKGCASRKAEMLDAAVEKAVLRRLRNIKPDDYSSDNPEIAAAEKRIRELEADLKTWQAKAIAEEVSAEMYAQVEKDRKRKIAELRPRTVPQQRQLLTYATWGQGTIREKRETVRALLVISIPSMKGLGRRAREDDVNITPK